MSSKCNTQKFSRRKPTKAFTRLVVDLVNNFLQGFFAELVKIVTFREIETQNIIGILVRAALPGLMRLRKVYLRMQRILQLPEFGEFRAVVQRDAVHRKSA